MPELGQLLKAWNNVDRPVARGASVSMAHIRSLHDSASASGCTLQLQLAHLLTSVIFFAMRPCEYSRVRRPSATVLLTVNDITFYDAKRLVIPTSQLSIHSKPEFVSVTFRNQKNRKKNEARIQRRTDDPLICPVKAWLFVINSILATSNNDTSKTVNYFLQNNAAPQSPTKWFISQHDTTQFLRHTCHAAKGAFGYAPKDVSAKGIRSGAAMAMWIAGCSTSEIMLLGRWTSDAFLVYLRPQTFEATEKLSQMMISTTNIQPIPTQRMTETTFQSRGSDAPLTRRSALTNKNNNLIPFNGLEPLNYLMPALHLY